MAQRVAWLPRQAVTSVVTKQPACVALVRSAQVRKLVRTESDGAGHEVVKGLHPALLRPSGLMRPVRACAKRAGHAGAGDAP